MDDDTQQAESERYSNKAFFVLPLDSGRIAVLGPRRTIYCIVDTWEEAKRYGGYAHLAEPPPPVQVVDLRPVIRGIAVDLSNLI